MTLKELAQEYGFGTAFDACEALGWHTDSVVPGFCKQKDCQYYTEVEPDAERYDCEECTESGTVNSVLIVMGVI